MGNKRTDRHIEITKKLLTLSKKLLKEGNETKDIKVSNLAIMFLIINGAYLDNRSFMKLSNLMKMFSRSELFESLMETELKTEILNTINSFVKKEENLESILNEAIEHMDYEICFCGPQEIQAYDGTKYPQYRNFCLNCGGQIQ